MYNASKPSAEDLPSAMKLLKSTTIAFAVAVVLLIGAVLPAEYGIDPTGVGRLLGLTQMGEIKENLAVEAAADQAAVTEEAPPVIEPKQSGETSATGEIPAVVEETTEDVVEVQPVETEPVAPLEPQWRDQFSFTLVPDEGVEYKLVMEEGGVARYSWVSTGGVVNYDLHGDGSGQSISYEKGRGVASDEGDLTAAFTGNHGWFWRNRTDATVTVTVHLNGDYSEIKKPD